MFLMGCKNVAKFKSSGIPRMVEQDQIRKGNKEKNMWELPRDEHCYFKVWVGFIQMTENIEAAILAPVLPLTET